jgi:LacI family transcriptional regulator
VVDQKQGAELATAHLLDLGHGDIAHIAGTANNPDAQARLEGYRQTLESRGVHFNPELVIHGNFFESSAMLAVESFLLRGQYFSAIFAANDHMAMGARLALGRRGLRVPEDVSLVGFDDLAISAYTFPPLTTVHQPAREMGYEASRFLVARIHGEERSLPQFTARLVVRESTMRKGSPVV